MTSLNKLQSIDNYYITTKNINFKCKFKSYMSK